MKEYKVTMEMPGMSTSFTTDDKDATLRAFNMKATINLTKPNGDVFVVRTEDYSYIEVDAVLGDRE